MKKIIFPIITVLLVIMIVFSTIGIANAETIYYYNGYLYTYINNEKVSLYGVEDTMTDLVVPDTLNGRAVVDIQNRAFMDNSTITGLDLSNAEHLERIGLFAFWKCTNLSGALTLPKSITNVETAAFQECTSLESVSIQTQDSEVSNQCFYGCTSLSSVTLGDNITSIGYLAFADCPNLKYLEIPSKVTQIGSTAFLNDEITLGVYTNSYAHQYAIDNEIPFILLDAPIPTEPPTEPEPTEAPTDAPTEEPTVPATEAPTEAQVKYLGDVDGDGTVTSIDATLIQRHLCYIKTMISDEMIMMGDVDDDGIISIIDVSFIMRYLATIEVPYPIGKPIINN